MTNKTNLERLLKNNLVFVCFFGMLAFFDVSSSLNPLPLDEFLVLVDLLVPVVAVDAELMDS